MHFANIAFGGGCEGSKFMLMLMMMMMMMMMINFSKGGVPEWK